MTIQELGIKYKQVTIKKRKDLEKTETFEFHKNEAAYSQPGNYPGYYAKLHNNGIMRGQQIANLWIYPYQYDPTTSKLYVYSDLKVKVEFLGELKDIDFRYKSKSFEKLYVDLAINGHDILKSQKEVAKPHVPPLLGSYGWDYLIFTVSDFSAAANGLAAWKRQLGFKPLVTIVPPHFTSTDIYNSIYHAYTSYDITPEYVLLLGDAEFIPTSYQTWYLHNSDDNDNSQGTIGTDLYYSLLKSDSLDPWGDLNPEVWIGRISVDEASQAHDRVNAIINYESPPLL